MVNSNKLREKYNRKKFISNIYYGLCPSCGIVSIFNGYISIKEKCSNCSYTINYEEIGDAAVWFSMLITSIIVAIGVLFLELSLHPDLWVHILIWVPVVFSIVIIILRPIKMFFIYLNYKKRD